MKHCVKIGMIVVMFASAWMAMNAPSLVTLQGTADGSSGVLDRSPALVLSERNETRVPVPGVLLAAAASDATVTGDDEEEGGGDGDEKEGEDKGDEEDESGGQDRMWDRVKRG